MTPFRLLLSSAFALFAAARLGAFPVAFGGMACDLPEGWTVLSSSEGVFAAASNGVGEGIGVFQASWFAPTAFPDAAEIAGGIMEKLGGRGDSVSFPFGGRSAVLADIRFAVGKGAARGYLLCVDGVALDVAVLAYSDEASYDAQHDFLLSSLDSFRTSGQGAAEPGPISQFLSPYPASGETRRVDFLGSAVPLRADDQELEATQTLIEREARILVRYASDRNRDEAWKRSFRIIYRDNYARLGETARAIGAVAGGVRASAADRAAAVLEWMQGFGYARTGSLSDLLSPLSTVAGRGGDCDARALAYLIIMSHLGVDGVLLVSSFYSHAVAAVAVEAPGVALVVDGRRYVLAETTTSVPLGWLAEEQRDISKWVVVRFDPAI